jgi:hypothetical protein
LRAQLREALVQQSHTTALVGSFCSWASRYPGRNATRSRYAPRGGGNAIPYIKAQSRHETNRISAAVKCSPMTNRCPPLNHLAASSRLLSTYLLAASTAAAPRPCDRDRRFGEPIRPGGEKEAGGSTGQAESVSCATVPAQSTGQELGKAPRLL